jgi:hypothetical protein
MPTATKTNPMTLDKWLKKEPLTTLELLGDQLEIEPEAKGFILGVLGNSSAKIWTGKCVKENCMEPILEEVGYLPEKLLCPSDGATSMLLQSWAEHAKVPCASYSADWGKLGRKARAIRDSQIMKESTHLLIFLGGRSDFYEKIAIREVKKGKVVYVIDSKTAEISSWVAED